jgi:hypothetical protein
MDSPGSFMDSFPSPFDDKSSTESSVLDSMDFFSNWGKKLGGKDETKGRHQL